MWPGGVWPLLQGTKHRVRGNHLRVCQGRFTFNIRKNSFTERVIRYWSERLIGGAGVMSREVFEGGLAVSLGAMARGWVTARTRRFWGLFHQFGDAERGSHWLPGCRGSAPSRAALSGLFTTAAHMDPPLAALIG